MEASGKHFKASGNIWKHLEASGRIWEAAGRHLEASEKYLRGKGGHGRLGRSLEVKCARTIEFYCQKSNGPGDLFVQMSREQVSRSPHPAQKSERS